MQYELDHLRKEIKRLKDIECKYYLNKEHKPEGLS